MAIYTVTTDRADDGGSDEVMTLSEAVALANASAGADTIRFAEGVEVLQRGAAYTVDAAGGPLTIDGDRDGDGVSDVVIEGGDSRAFFFIVETGGQLMVRNVDFSGGQVGVGVGSGRAGEEGDYGGTAPTAVPFGIHGGEGNRGGDGTAGENGGTGFEWGVFVNRGNLVLERVGFGDITVLGTPGGSGGEGGNGGASIGGDGIADTTWQDTPPVDPVTSDEWRWDYPGAATNDANSPFAGNGGAGGVAGHGGTGGEGGTGGAAGLILNETGGDVTLTDVVFGGRLSSGLVGGGNTVQGGHGGIGGDGGNGGLSVGGNGADGGEEWSRLFLEEFYVGDSLKYRGWFYHVDASDGGTGGDSGTPGTGANGGTGGTGGAGGLIVNRGSVAGTLAAVEDGAAANMTVGGDGGLGGDGGDAGHGRVGDGGENRMERLQEGRYGGYKIGGGLISSQGWTGWDAFRQPLLDLIRYSPPHFDGSADDGVFRGPGIDGLDGDAGLAGGNGNVVGTGTADTASGGSLVYLHGGGTIVEGDSIGFTIARLGDISGGVTVHWELSGTGAGGVGADDFSGATTGSVTFAAVAAVPADGTVRDESNVARVSVTSRGDGTAEATEGWQVRITSVDGDGVVLGTSRIDGMLEDDGEVDGGGGEEKTGTPGDDKLDGGDGADLLRGLAGADVLRGMGGDDTLEGGDGPDTLNGGDGDDLIRGGDTEADRRDVIYGGAGNDSIDGGYGNDLIFGQGGNDTIAGGFGADELQGQDGDDVITGSAFGDIVFGNAGDDFVNGGFGHDLINGGAGADKFFHTGGTREQMEGHGSDWVQDYSAAEGDVLVFGGSGTASQFQVNLTHTANKSTGERSGDDDVEEAFVIYKPTGQILWALVDGGGQASINLQIGAEVFDLLA